MPITKSSERGVTSVEFALVAALLLSLLFGVMELGRILFVWNSAQEVTRRAARDAAVQGLTLFTPYDAVLQPGTSSGTMAFPGIGEITNWTVSIQFMTGDFGALAATAPPTNATLNQSNCTQGLSPCVTAVQASLCAPGSTPCQPVSYLPIGIFGSVFQLLLPISTVTLPLESAGAISG
ncbi:MAG: TadE/TadG family type IV pilus assembly protein [Burkholderiales bacterium]